MAGTPAEDYETLVSNEAEGSKLELRVWLRLLSCANLISADIRRNLRSEFDVTLPRFDVMAQLNREPKGLRLGDLSRRMMVSNGNITGLIDRLAEEGLVSREPMPDDRRVIVVKLTREGTRMFRRMATAHEAWVRGLMSAIPRAELETLFDDLDLLKSSVRQKTAVALESED